MIARFDALPTHEGPATFIERSQDATGTFFALNRHDGHGLAFGHTAAERKPERVRPRCDEGMRRAGGRLEFEHGGHTGHAGKVLREKMPRPGDLEQQHLGFDPPHRAIVFEHGLVKRNGREAARRQESQETRYDGARHCPQTRWLHPAALHQSPIAPRPRAACAPRPPSRDDPTGLPTLTHGSDGKPTWRDIRRWLHRDPRPGPATGPRRTGMQPTLRQTHLWP